MRQTVRIEKAAEIAEQFGDGEFIAAVEQAEAVGLKSIEIATVSGEGDADEIYVLRPQGVMIAWKPSDHERHRIAVPDGTPCDEVHLTIKYLGKTSDWTEEQQRTILGVVTQVAQKHGPIAGRVNRLGRFYTEGENDEGDPIWLGGDFRGLRELRDDIVHALNAAGIVYEDTYPDFTPHITVGYIDSERDMPPVTINAFDTVIDNVTVYWGGLEYPIALDGPTLGAGEIWATPWEDGNLYVPVLKAETPVLDEEKRYSYGPWYVPDSLDLHGEWASADDVQEALWKYVDRGDRGIRLQHMPEIEAGRWVELATMPFPVTVPIVGEGGTMLKHTYPAGTPFMGVIWEPWAWDLVKAGELRGLSIGGTAQRIEATFDPAAVAKARG